MRNNTGTCGSTDGVRFWDGYAKWYKLWFEHTAYYAPILEILMNTVEPGWRILDIGAGNGVLSVPFCRMGCAVTAIEPSVAMRSLLFEEAFRRDIDTMHVDDRKWEDIPLLECKDFDLVIACNSLHLPDMEFTASLEKVFRADPANVFVVMEHVPQTMIRFAYASHTLAFGRACETDNSMVYHNIEEAFAHHRYLKRKALLPEEKLDIERRMTSCDNHVRLDAKAKVGMYWFHRRLPAHYMFRQ